MKRQIIIWSNRLKKFRDNPRAIWPFLKKYLYYNWVADSYLSHYNNVKFLDYQTTIDTVIDNNRSFVRFGDDVFDMLLGIGLYFNDWRQRYEPDLAMRLREVLASGNPRLLVGFNPELILMNKQQFKMRGIKEQYHYWTHSKIFLKDYIRPTQVYGRALCFQERYFPELPYQKIFSFMEGKHLIIVASNTLRFGDKKFGISTDYIEGPSSDAWSVYPRLLNQVQVVAAKYPKDKVLIMCSLGPTSKVMTYDLTQSGYTVWDTGQFFDLAMNRLDKIN